MLDIPPEAVDAPETRALALRAAIEGTVLLKNLNNALPLNVDKAKNFNNVNLTAPPLNVDKGKVKQQLHIAFIGPHGARV
jgi:beta-glucosidase-like glycosyl hydrolase